MSALPTRSWLKSTAELLIDIATFCSVVKQPIMTIAEFLIGLTTLAALIFWYIKAH